MNGFDMPISSSSSTFISGEPWGISDMLNKSLAFPNMVKAALAAAAQEEEERLQRIYTNAGISADISVTYDADGTKFVATASGQEVVDAEYGSPVSDARALLRKNLIRDTSTIQKSIEKSIEKRLKA
jgi:hypothetical protein